jgi:hypothetical protein
LDGAPWHLLDLPDHYWSESVDASIDHAVGPDLSPYAGPTTAVLWVPTFLAELASSPNVSAAARAAGVTRQNAYLRRAQDPDFAARWEDAIGRSTDALIGAMWIRAVEGIEKPVFYRGKVCGHVREYSDSLAMFLAIAFRPAMYASGKRRELARARLAAGKEDLEEAERYVRWCVVSNRVPAA